MTRLEGLRFGRSGTEILMGNRHQHVPARRLMPAHGQDVFLGYMTFTRGESRPHDPRGANRNRVRDVDTGHPLASREDRGV